MNKGGKYIKGSEKFYCAISGAGVDSKTGRKDISKNFVISPDSLEVGPGK